MQKKELKEAIKQAIYHNQIKFEEVIKACQEATEDKLKDLYAKSKKKIYNKYL